MDTQKTIIRVLELFRSVAILFGISLMIFAVTAFYYTNNQVQEPPAFYCGVKPDDLSMNLSVLAVKGETLFKDNCAQCHAATNEQVVGPGLKGISHRRDVKWLRKWIRNPQKVLESKDKYVIELYNKFNKTQMTAFSNFTDQDIDAILKYVEEVGNRPVPVL